MSSARTPWSSCTGIGSACSARNQPGSTATDMALCDGDVGDLVEAAGRTARRGRCTPRPSRPLTSARRHRVRGGRARRRRRRGPADQRGEGHRAPGVDRLGVSAGRDPPLRRRGMRRRGGRPRRRRRARRSAPARTMSGSINADRVGDGGHADDARRAQRGPRTPAVLCGRSAACRARAAWRGERQPAPTSCRRARRQPERRQQDDAPPQRPHHHVPRGPGDRPAEGVVVDAADEEPADDEHDADAAGRPQQRPSDGRRGPPALTRHDDGDDEAGEQREAAAARPARRRRGRWRSSCRRTPGHRSTPASPTRSAATGARRGRRRRARR